MTIKRLFNYPVETTTLTRKHMVATMLLVWLAWFFVNLGANGLFYISLRGRPDARLPGEMLYYLGVSVVGIVWLAYRLLWVEKSIDGRAGEETSV
jgi:hypothetical protein